jgi:hypothetical protein
LLSGKRFVANLGLHFLSLLATGQP